MYIQNTGVFSLCSQGVALVCLWIVVRQAVNRGDWKHLGFLTAGESAKVKSWVGVASSGSTVWLTFCVQESRKVLKDRWWGRRFPSKLVGANTPCCRINVPSHPLLSPQIRQSWGFLSLFPPHQACSALVCHQKGVGQPFLLPPPL